jgi:cytochrome c biogenesis protein
MAAARAAARATPAADRLARAAERALRVLGDGRTGLLLLVATAAANAVAAFLPDGPRLLDAPPYAMLLGALALSGVAAVAVRAPAAWREWRRPGPVQPGPGALEASLPLADPERLVAALAAAGHRARLERGRGRNRDRWAIHAVRRGWARFAGILSHLALVVIVLGAAIGAAFGSESVFSLLTGDQALLDLPRPGFSSAVRLDSFEAELGADGRPESLDTRVTFLRDGSPARDALLRVNDPGEFDGYLVHAWTYGPAVRLRVTTLGGSALLDAPVPLDGVRDGVAVGSAELPTLGLTLGLALTDADANELGVSVVGASGGLVDSARLHPGEDARIGDLEVALEGFDAWVTFVSRRDPGLGVLFGGAVLLCGSLAVAFWLPRRRLTIRSRANDLGIVLRGERFDRPADELGRLLERLRGAA